MAQSKTMHYYRSGETAFYTVSDADGVMAEGFRFDRADKRFVSDIAGVTRRLYVSPEDTDELDRATFHALIKAQGGEGAP